MKFKANPRGTAPNLGSWTLTTPVGTASWPKLNEPESYNGGDPKYGVKLLFDEDDPVLVGLRKQMDEMMAFTEQSLTKLQANKGTAVYPLKPQMRKVKDEEGDVVDEEPTGEVYISATRYAKKKDGSKNKIPFVDANGNVLTRPPEIHGGSKLRLQVWAKPYYMNSTNEYGISFSLNAVQIVELSEGYKSGPSFDAVDGGWTPTDGLEQAAGVDTEDTPF